MIYGLVVMRIFFNTSCLLKAGALQDMLRYKSREGAKKIVLYRRSLYRKVGDA